MAYRTPLYRAVLKAYASSKLLRTRWEFLFPQKIMISWLLLVALASTTWAAPPPMLQGFNSMKSTVMLQSVKVLYRVTKDPPCTVMYCSAMSSTFATLSTYQKYNAWCTQRHITNIANKNKHWTHDKHCKHC